MNIKKLLLDTDVVNDNIYLEKYCKLIELNLTTKRQLYKTQKHHIIPKCYYKSLNLPVNNEKNNLVNLLFKDHILAHYYLTLCAKDLNFKAQNAVAVKLYGEQSDISSCITELDNLQQVYELAAKYIGQTKKGKCYVSKGNVVIMIPTSELDNYLSNGYIKGNNLLKNKCCITNGHEDKVINKEDLNEYIAKGFRKGHSHKTSQKLSKEEYKTIHFKDKEEKRVPKKELNYWLEQGYEVGVLPTSKRKQGHPCPYKGTKGLVKGTKGLIWVTNGKVNKRIHYTKIEKFLTENIDFFRGITQGLNNNE